MPIPPEIVEAFTHMIAAAKADKVILMQVTNGTGAVRYAVCIKNAEDEEGMSLTPLAVMLAEDMTPLTPLLRDPEARLQ
jgi:hypothetical protein